MNSISTFKDLLSEYFDIAHLDENSQKLYHLIDRYKSKVSDRLKRKKQELREEGKALFKEALKEVLANPNPFLELLSKDNTWGRGAYLPIPIDFNKNPDDAYPVKSVKQNTRKGSGT